MGINIIDDKLKFPQARSVRTLTVNLVIHHTAGSATQTVQGIHQQHINQSWNGIGYNGVVYQNGEIHLGRGWQYVGAGATGFNSNSIHICFIGNFSETKTVPAAQYASGVELVRWLLEQWPSITRICGHRDLMATACPGTYFPLAEMIADATKQPAAPKEPDAYGFYYPMPSVATASGATGDDVRAVQERLIKMGYRMTTGADGDYGPLTAGSVASFQTDVGIKATGQCDIGTLAAIGEYANYLSEEGIEMSQFEEHVKKISAAVVAEKMSGEGTELPKWAKDGGEYDQAVERGLTDGQRPGGLTTRTEFAVGMNRVVDYCMDKLGDLSAGK